MVSGAGHVRRRHGRRLTQPILHTKARFDTKFAQLESLVLGSSGRYRIARTVQDVRDAKAAGALAVIVGSEGAAQLAGVDPILWTPDVYPERVAEYHARGWRKAQLYYTMGEGLASPLWFQGPGGGAYLSVKGREVVRAMNRLGVLIDVEHLNPQHVTDVLSEAKAPLLLSHQWPSPGIQWTPGELQRIAESGGGYGVIALMFITSGRSEPIFPQGAAATAADVAAQLASLVAIVGEDHVAYGGDYMPPDYTYGPYTYTPASIASLRDVTNALYARGMSEPLVKKIIGENMMTLYDRAWDPTRGYGGGSARFYTCTNASSDPACLAARSHGGQGDFNHRPLSCFAATAPGPIALQLGYRNGAWVYWSVNTNAYPCQDGSLLAVSWGDGAPNGEFALCSNSSSAATCAGAASAGGYGTSETRAVNCLATNSAGPIALQLRYSASTWQFYNILLDPQTCSATSTLAVRWGPSANGTAQVQLCDDKLGDATCLAAAANGGNGTGSVRPLSCYNSIPASGAHGTVGLQLTYTGTPGSGRWAYYDIHGILTPCVGGSVLVVRP